MSDRTYAEATGHAPFDWNKWLDAAIEKTPSRDELYQVSLKSQDWCTCACGNECAIIPRKRDGEPEDDALSDLGFKFHVYINSCLQAFDHEIRPKLITAREILEDIEARSAFVIEQELAKLNQE